VSVVDHKETIVVGAGVGGCTAGLYAKRYGQDVLILDKAAPGGLAATAAHIANYPGFPEGISGLELAERVHQQARNHGTAIELVEVTGLEPHNDEWLLHTTGGDYVAIAIIIAAGARPRTLQVPGETELRGMGVSYCATCDGFFFRDETVAVIGGGDVALEEAVYLSELAAKVYVVHRRDELRAQSHLQQQAFALDNIEFIWDSVVTEIIGDQQVEGLLIQNKKTADQRRLDLDGVFITIGYVAATQWLGNIVELNDGFIVTDQYMRTNRPGIFAVGDIRSGSLRQIATAVGDGAIAAHSAYEYVNQRQEQ